MLNDLLLQHLRRRQVIQVVQAVVFQPEDVETGLITRQQLVIAKELKALCLAAFVPVFRVVALDEVL